MGQANKSADPPQRWPNDGCADFNERPGADIYARSGAELLATCDGIMSTPARCSRRIFAWRTQKACAGSRIAGPVSNSG